MSHIQIESDTSMPFIPWSNYQFCEMLTFGVTEGVMVTFRQAVGAASRRFLQRERDMTHSSLDRTMGIPYS